MTLQALRLLRVIDLRPNLKIPMVADLHYSIKPFYGRDESKVFEHLYRALKVENPNLVLSAGDFGEEVTEEMFRPILREAFLLRSQKRSLMIS
ncbi:MAG: hypothetical protein QXH91_03470 [Candidatus Bathyarchaeia archaeon]